jgi:hypothetical protein
MTTPRTPSEVEPHPPPPGDEPPLAAAMTALTARLAADPRLSDRVVTRPHPLLVTVRHDRLFALIAPAAVWDRGREVLRPFAARFAEGEALMILLGRPSEPDLAQALNRGLGALLSPDPNADELFVAVHNAFELLESKARSESRGKWLNRYRYELGELIERAGSSPAPTRGACTWSRATTPSRGTGCSASSSPRTPRWSSTPASSPCR